MATSWLRDLLGMEWRGYVAMKRIAIGRKGAEVGISAWGKIQEHQRELIGKRGTMVFLGHFEVGERRSQNRIGQCGLGVTARRDGHFINQSYAPKSIPGRLGVLAAGATVANFYERLWPNGWAPGFAHQDNEGSIPSGRSSFMSGESWGWLMRIAW